MPPASGVEHRVLDRLAHRGRRDLVQRVLGVQRGELGLQLPRSSLTSLSACSASSRASATVCSLRDDLPFDRTPPALHEVLVLVVGQTRRLPRMCSTRLAHRLPSA